MEKTIDHKDIKEVIYGLKLYTLKIQGGCLWK